MSQFLHLIHNYPSKTKLVSDMSFKGLNRKGISFKINQLAINYKFDLVSAIWIDQKD